MQNLALVNVSLFKQGQILDKNNLPAVYLNVLAGNIPQNAHVISGTGSQMYQLEVGETYTVLCETTKGDPYDKQAFTFLPKSDFSILFEARKLAGVPQQIIKAIQVAKKEEVEDFIPA